MTPKHARAGHSIGMAALIGLYLAIHAAAWATPPPQPDAADGPKDCSVGELRNPQGLSPEKLEISQALFVTLCRRSAAPLVNADDARFDGRLERPTPRKSPRYLALSHPLPTDSQGRVAGTVTLAVIVGIDGEVSWDAVLESTADKEVTDLALRTLRSAIFSKPALLDGKPVRVYYTTRFGHSETH